MALKKDKQKVLGEVFDDDRVKSFLIIEEREEVNTDYALLERAYRGMKAENFSSFVEFFNEAGKDINAQGPEGLSFAQSIQAHKNANDYLLALRAGGAKL